MEFIVDFNMEEEDGRIPARIPSAQAWAVEIGAKVVALDGEGTECWAIVDEVDSQHRYVMLAPVPGTARTADTRSTEPHASLL